MFHLLKKICHALRGGKTFPPANNAENVLSSEIPEQEQQIRALEEKLEQAFKKANDMQTLIENLRDRAKDKDEEISEMKGLYRQQVEALTEAHEEALEERDRKISSLRDDLDYTLDCIEKAMRKLADVTSKQTKLHSHLADLVTAIDSGDKATIMACIDFLDMEPQLVHIAQVFIGLKDSGIEE